MHGHPQDLKLDYEKMFQAPFALIIARRKEKSSFKDWSYTPRYVPRAAIRAVFLKANMISLRMEDNLREGTRIVKTYIYGVKSLNGYRPFLAVKYAIMR